MRPQLHRETSEQQPLCRDIRLPVIPAAVPQPSVIVNALLVVSRVDAVLGARSGPEQQERPSSPHGYTRVTRAVAARIRKDGTVI
jgi:hypothetical protein